MSIVAYPPTNNNEEIFRRCTRQCGMVLSTEDQIYFALECLLCQDKFLYLNAFVDHIKRKHAFLPSENEIRPGKRRHEDCGDEPKKFLSNIQPPVHESSSVVIKEEKYDMDDNNHEDETCIKNEPLQNNDYDYPADGYYDGGFKAGQNDTNFNMTSGSAGYMADTSYAGESNASYNDDYEDDDDEPGGGDDDANYDDMVEESLLNSSSIPGITNHIKDRKMIIFLIEAFKRNSFLWDPDHPQFRDRIKRNQFVKWMNDEFKRRFNLTLARDAVTRKWENLRTVYKRECIRMAMENTNISTLWYFKELYFLNHLYGGKQENMETVYQGAAQRKRLFAIWNDVSTNKMIELIKKYPCMYDRSSPDYGHKEKKAEALQQMTAELAPIVEVSPLQISKRIAQLRYDYGKQKQERIRCEITGNMFTPSYSYYDQMLFMDDDIAPFKCDQCIMVLKSIPELEVHQLSHKQQNAQYSNLPISSAMDQHSNSMDDFNVPSNYNCPVCQLSFPDVEQLNRHKQIHPQFRDVVYQCDLCTASFRDKNNYEEHTRRHNDELLLPDLNLITPGDSNDEVITGDNTSYFSSSADDSSNSSAKHRCYYPGCNREFTSRSNVMVHTKTHYKESEYICDICGKVFRTSKNLQNHKQIHSAVKKYVCKVCGSAFAQAAGLYLHKRRHNRQV